MSRASRFPAILLGTICLLSFTGTTMAQDSSAASGQSNVEITHYQDWTVRCKTSAQCQMTQLVKNPETGRPVMRVVMGYPPRINRPALIFLLPLGVGLPPGVVLTVNGSQTYHFPYKVCMEQGCRASLVVDDTLLAKLKNGIKAKVRLAGPQGKPISLKFSLMGFTAANNAIAP